MQMNCIWVQLIWVHCIKSIIWFGLCTSYSHTQNPSFWFCLLSFQRSVFYQTTDICCDVDPVFTHCNIFALSDIFSPLKKVNSIKIQALSSISISICSLQMNNESEHFFSSKSLSYETIKFSMVGAGGRLQETGVQFPQEFGETDFLDTQTNENFMKKSLQQKIYCFGFNNFSFHIWHNYS